MFSLTRQERQVILFLIAAALIGMGIDFLCKINSDKQIIAHITEDLAKIDLNSADKDLLMSVSGIGTKIAERITEYRKQQGAFQDLAELKNIKGITGYRYEKIKDYFTIK